LVRSQRISKSAVFDSYECFFVASSSLPSFPPNVPPWPPYTVCTCPSHALPSNS
jgi:hypothetical protein